MDQIYRMEDMLVIAHCPEYVGTSIFSPKSESRWNLNIERTVDSINCVNHKAKDIDEPNYN